ncbi:coil containing protein [Vibrio phage 2.117.O._10N.261.45.E9]|nr:coil containing protein [Vibrio phage 1.117.O._10N.261.45.E9]AUR95424.1 coil containing protein [Vibrio phage 1.207.B._10N.222.51.C2]AUS02315.1 coil containing protein [Vibrio phage 2.117.O._10N.261.45.E9]
MTVESSSAEQRLMQLEAELAAESSTRKARYVEQCRVFVRHYMACGFNATEAARRMGVSEASATQRGYTFRNRAVCRLMVEIRQLQLDEDDIITRKEILYSLKREMHNTDGDGNASTRIQATATAAKIKGMTNDQPAITVQNHGGVMVVPATKNVDEWEAAASQSQQELKDSVKE